MLSDEEQEEKSIQELDRNFQPSMPSDLDILEDTVGLYIDRLAYLKSKIASFRDLEASYDQEEEEKQGYLSELFQLTKSSSHAHSFDLFRLQEGYKDPANLLSKAMKERDEALNELETLRPQHDEVNGKLEETDSELQILREENEQLRRELEAKEKAFSNLEIQKESLDKQRTRLEGDLAVLKKEKYDLTTTFLSQTDEDLREEILLLKDQLKLEKTKRSSLQLRIQRMGTEEPKSAGNQLVTVSLEDICNMVEEHLLDFSVSNMERDMSTESSFEEGTEDKRLRLKREEMRVFSRFIYQLSSDQMGILFYLLQRVDAGEELEEVQRTFHLLKKERIMSSPKPVVISHVSTQDKRQLRENVARKGVLNLEVKELEDEEGEFTSSSLLSKRRPVDPVESFDPLDDESFRLRKHSDSGDLAPPVSPSATEDGESEFSSQLLPSTFNPRRTQAEEVNSTKQRPRRMPPTMPEDSSDEQQLPPNWESFLDDLSGEVYYHNFRTGETTWDPPSRSNKKKKKKGRNGQRSRSSSFSSNSNQDPSRTPRSMLFDQPTASSSKKTNNPNFVYQNSLAESSSSMFLFDRNSADRTKKLRRTRSFSASTAKAGTEDDSQYSPRGRTFTTYNQGT